VTVLGCLQSGDSPAATLPATAGRPPLPAAQAAGDTSNGAAFVLRDAKPETGAAGVGRNGAGGSGGPLLSGISDYTLQGDVSELRRYVNQEVRITARIDPQQIVVPQEPRGSASGPVGNADPRSSGPSGPPASGASTGSATSATGAEKTTGTVSGSNTSNTGATQHAVAHRQLIVDSVTSVALTCSRP
jgi:hypothetical protein